MLQETGDVLRSGQAACIRLLQSRTGETLNREAIRPHRVNHSDTGFNMFSNCYAKADEERWGDDICWISQGKLACGVPAVENLLLTDGSWSRNKNAAPVRERGMDMS